MNDLTLDRAKLLVENEIRPMILGDGGDIEVAGLTDDGILQLRVLGQCTNCASLPMTMTFAIENRVKEAIPEIKGVIQVAG